jgi:hypothetical protein
LVCIVSHLGKLYEKGVNKEGKGKSKIAFDLKYFALDHPLFCDHTHFKLSEGRPDMKPAVRTLGNPDTTCKVDCPFLSVTVAVIQCFVCAAFFFASNATAGAWTPQQGDANIIISTSISQTPVADQAITTDLYYERGLGRGWALVLAPSVSEKSNVFARNEAQVSIRRAIYEDRGWALSAQVGAYTWKEEATDAASSGVEYRLALGKSFGQGAWANVEAATRRCGGSDKLRWEGTLGHRVRRYDRAIVKAFGDGEGCAPSISRLQASYVYGFNDRIGIELGWRETLPNPGNWNEKGAVVGLWLAF